jgi:threonine aldolase
MTLPLNMADDSHIPPPQEMAAALARLSVGADADYYGQGGAVAAFEAQAAAYLGKERAVMFPTGTLGNMMALRLLTGGAPARVIVHRQSHFYNDSGDNLSQLAGLTMVPLEGEGAGFSADQLRAEIARTASARVAARIGAVTVESPSRRLHNRSFGTALPGVIAAAREAGLPLFLDGARMPIECAWTGQDPAAMAAPFDLVYLSLYKYLKAPFGCIIAGPAALLEGLYHDRRRFGGSLWQMWPAAVLAADALPQQAATWAAARVAAADALAAMRDAGLAPAVFADGSNVMLFDCAAPPEAMVAAARAEGIRVLPPSGGRLAIKVNETWIGRDPADTAGRLARALAAGG